MPDCGEGAAGEDNGSAFIGHSADERLVESGEFTGMPAQSFLGKTHRETGIRRISDLGRPAASERRISEPAAGMAAGELRSGRTRVGAAERGQPAGTRYMDSSTRSGPIKTRS